MIRGTEGIVRRARKLNPSIDVVFLHFVDPEKMAVYRAGGVPLVIQQHETVAQHYGVSSVHLAREVTDRIDEGEFTWEHDFKDLHPSPFGQRLYAASISRLLHACWDDSLAAEGPPLGLPSVMRPHTLPQPLDPLSHDAAEIVALDSARELQGFPLVPECDPRTGGIGGDVRSGFVGVPMLVGTAPPAQLTLSFQGRAVGIWVAAGPDAGKVEHRVDGGPWQTTDLFTPWSAGLHLPWVYMLEAELDGASHKLELRIAATHNPSSRGHAVRIAHFLVNR